jgi:hypothetical protein
MTSETTDVGEQNLIPGVAPVTLRQRLQALANLPLTARTKQRSLDVGLFDEVGRAQLDIFDGDLS